MMQHGDGQRRVLRLMRARQRGEGQGEFAMLVGIVQPGFCAARMPAACAHREQGFSRQRSPLDLQLRAFGIGQRHQRNARLGDACLLEGDAGERFGRHIRFRREQEPLVVQPQRRDPAGGEHLWPQHIGRIEAAAEADLDHAGVSGHAREGEERGGDGHFEEAGVEVVRFIQHFFEQRCELRIIDQCSRDPDALVIAHQVRTGGDVDPLAIRLQHRAQEGAGRSLAVGARDVEHWRQTVLRVAQPGQQSADRPQSQAAIWHRERGQPVELGLHGRIVGAGEVLHFVSPLSFRGGEDWFKPPQPYRPCSAASLPARP